MQCAAFLKSNLLICVMKVYSGHIPYPESRPEMVVANVAVHGTRPSRPLRLRLDLWRLVEGCWRQDYAKRYNIETVRTRIHEMVSPDQEGVTGRSRDTGCGVGGGRRILNKVFRRNFF
jgi:hypothetical protein